MKIKEKVKFAFLSTIYAPFNKQPKVMSSSATIDYIVEHKCSIARFGDGEIGLMYGRSLSFQS